MGLLRSRKFWTLAIAVGLSYGLDINAETQALIILAAGSIFAGTTAWEDAADKRRTRYHVADDE